MDDFGILLFKIVILLGIVIVLFVLNALKAYPERKKAIVFYVLLTLAAVVCFTLQFI